MSSLLQARIDTLYRADGRGRIIATNEWDARPAPRLHLMSTPHGAILRARDDVSDALAARLARLAAAEPAEPPSPASPRSAPDLLRALETAAPVTAIWRGPAYRLGGPPRLSGDAIEVGAANAELLRPWFADWIGDVPHRRPFLTIVEDGCAVSLCASVRISAKVHCAGVETCVPCRGRGLAQRVVAAWAAAVRALGAAPFYSTSWENLASQGVARAVGFQLAAVDFHAT